MNESNESLSPFEDQSEPLIPDEMELTIPDEAEEALPPANALNRRKKIFHRLPMFLSFALPFCIASIAYVVSMLFTDGTNMLLSSDGWHQYYPFLVTLREKLLSGGSMEYSWVVGMGGSFPSLYAYYLASPMYLLSVLIPLDSLPHYFTLMTILKLSLAGFFFGWFLRLVYRRNDIAIPFFSLAYAFCAWAAGYYWNIMWLDTFALLPLLIAGTVCLLRDGKFRLYIIALALSLWCNYYIAFFCCIFVLLCFVGYCICCWNGFMNFLRRFLRIGICTLLGAGLACILLIPTLLAMQTTYSSTAKEFPLLHLNIAEDAYGTIRRHGNLWEMLKSETLPGIISSTREVLAGLMPATEPTSLEGLPNIFCGLSTVMLSVYYFCCQKISLREKLFNLCLLAFLLLSFILRLLDYVWHGFHFPNMIPYRFSFLFCFVLIAMAYRAFTLLDDFKLWHFFIIVPVSALLIYNAYTQGNFGTTQQLLSLVVFLGVIVLFFLLHFIFSKIKQKNTLSGIFWQKIGKALVLSLLFLILSCEMIVSLAFGINKIGFTSQYNEDGSVVYPRKNENVQALLNYLDSKQDDPLFYRTEVTNTQTLNDAALNGYNGISIFNSSTNANFNRLSRSLGLASWVGSNRFVYYESSPFTNTMCGIKYLIDRTGSHYNTDYNSLIAESGTVNLLENNTFISVGFMTNSELADFVAVENSYNPINEQEEMFRLATSIEDELYEHLTAEDFEKPFGGSIRATGTSGTQYSYTTTTSASEYQDVAIIYTIEEDGLYVATTKRPTDAESKIKIYRNNKLLFSLDTKVRMLFCVGSFEKGDKLKFVYSVPSENSGNISLDLAKQNNDVFDAGLATLADEPFVVSEFSDGYVRGTIEVLSDGLFYTSIPYEPGWTAYVDGKEVTLAPGYDAQNTDVLLSDAVVCFPLSAGTHEIELVYTAPGLTLGAIISAVCLLIFIALWIILRKNPVLLPDQFWQKHSVRMSNKMRLLTLGIGSIIVSVLCADLLWVLWKGAKLGYQTLLEEHPSHLITKLLPFIEGNDDDAVFLLLAVIALFLVPFTLRLWYRFVRHACRLLKSARTAAKEKAAEIELSTPEDISDTNDIFAAEEYNYEQQEPPAEEDSGTKESLD